ncbi:MAG TPA: hypothetical protein VIO61_02840 [Anaerolineaceae bacterium]
MSLTIGDIRQFNCRKALLVNFILSLLFTLCWFTPLRSSTFMGDDLSLIKQYGMKKFGVSPWSDFLYKGAAKFRPVFTVPLGIITRTCEYDFPCYINVNLAFFVINTMILSIAVYFISNRWLVSIFLSSFLFIISRFSYYSVLQLIGFVENLSMTFFLLMLLFLVLYRKDQKLKWLISAVAAYGLLIYTHERFIILAFPLCALVAISFLSKYLSKLYTIGLLLLIILGTSSNLLIKQYYFHIPFLVGTGGTEITNTFSIGAAIVFFLKGSANMIGINAGPNWLSGIHFMEAGITGILISIFSTAACLSTFIVFLVQKPRDPRARLQDYLLIFIFASIIASLVASASVTIRQEYRWLYTPFAAFILLLCYILGQIQVNRTRLILTAILALSFACADGFYRQYQNNVFFFDGMRTTDAVKTQIIDHYPLATLAKSKIIILDYGNKPLREWYLNGDYFFKLYSHLPKVDVEYVNTRDQIQYIPTPDQPWLIYEIRNQKVTEITWQILQR